MKHLTLLLFSIASIINSTEISQSNTLNLKPNPKLMHLRRTLKPFLSAYRNNFQDNYIQDIYILIAQDLKKEIKEEYAIIYESKTFDELYNSANFELIKLLNDSDKFKSILGNFTVNFFEIYKDDLYANNFDIKFIVAKAIMASYNYVKTLLKIMILTKEVVKKDVIKEDNKETCLLLKLIPTYFRNKR